VINLNPLKTQIISAYETGTSALQISRLISPTVGKIVDRGTILARLRQWNVLIREGYFLRSDVITTLSEKEVSILQGLLLSDGYLGRRNMTPRFGITSIHKPYVKWISTNLPFDFRRIYSVPEKYVNRNGKIYRYKECHQLSTNADRSLISFAQTWYPNGKKIVPRSLKLNPTVLLHWFLGDGSSSYSKNSKSICVSFSTDSFSENDCEFLIEQLYQLHPQLQFNKYHSKGKPFLRSGRKETVGAFFDIIGTPLLQCFAYKWKSHEDISSLVD
jgi:hypothetical protein